MTMMRMRNPSGIFLFCGADADTDFAYSAGTAGGISTLSVGRRVLPRLRLGIVVCIAIRRVTVLRGVWLRVVRIGLIRRLRGIIADMLNGLRLWRNVHVRDGLGFRRLLGIRERLCRGGRKRSVPG